MQHIDFLIVNTIMNIVNNWMYYLYTKNRLNYNFSISCSMNLQKFPKDISKHKHHYLKTIHSNNSNSCYHLCTPNIVMSITNIFHYCYNSLDYNSVNIIGPILQNYLNSLGNYLYYCRFHSLWHKQSKCFQD